MDVPEIRLGTAIQVSYDELFSQNMILDRKAFGQRGKWPLPEPGMAAYHTDSELEQERNSTLQSVLRRRRKVYLQADIKIVNMVNLESCEPVDGQVSGPRQCRNEASRCQSERACPSQDPRPEEAALWSYCGTHHRL